MPRQRLRDLAAERSWQHELELRLDITNDGVTYHGCKLDSVGGERISYDSEDTRVSD